jgi:hypothetical protein
MKDGYAEEGYFDYLMSTYWFREVTDLYFDGEYRQVYGDTLAELVEKRLVVRERRKLVSNLTR